MPRVVVTGIGFITSIGNNKSSVSRNLKELRHGIELYPPFQIESSPVKVAGVVKEFNTESDDPGEWEYPGKEKIKSETLRSLAPHGLFSYCAVNQAIEDAGLSEDEVSNERTGLFSASPGSMSNIHRNIARLHSRGAMRCSPMGIISSVAGTVNFNLVASLGIKGASSGFTSACSSSGHALGYGFDEIAQGRQDRMIVIGAEDGNLENILPFAAMRSLSVSSDPDRASRPFDRKRDGFVGTGGAAAMILESDEVACGRRASIYAEFLGWGQASDGYHVVMAHPAGEGLSIAMKNAVRASRISEESVDYVNAHAPSTLAGDLSEMKALRQVFQSGNGRPAISSTKALTGHGLSLASVMEASFCVLSLREGFIPGSAHIEEIDPEGNGLEIIRTSRDTKPEVVMSNSSGFGGTNVTLIFGGYKSS